MALQVWLPLNGNLNNQGLMNIAVTNNGNAAVNNNGKIGKCYYFNGSSYLSAPMDYSGFNNRFSVAFWFKLPSAPASNVELINFGPTAGWAVIYYGVVVGSNLTLSSSVSNGSSYIATGFNTTITTGKWHHYAFTFDDGVMNLYIDGVFVKTMTTSIVPALTNSTKIGIGAAPNGGEKSVSYMNDVRVYDHALSYKEVRELAKGLILHYKFDDRFFEPTKNLVTGITAGGQTTISGLSVTTSGNNSDTYFKLTLSEALVSGTTYTISCYAENVPYGKRWSFPIGAQSNTSVTFNIYNGYNSYTFTANATIANCGTSLMMDDNARGDVYMNKCIFHSFQIEKKDHATGYVVGERTGYGLAYDCSGYEHDGEYVLTAELDAQSPRYDACTHFVDDAPSADSNTGGFIRGPIHMSGHKEITFAWWGKHTPGYGGRWQGLLSTSTNSSYPSDYTTSTLNQYDNRFRFTNGTSGTDYHLDVASIVVSGEWHHYALTYDGAVAKGYRDGVLVTSLAFSYTQLGAFEYIYINRSHAGGVYRTNDGRWSDFRIYATALSQSDIEELYNVGQSIDKEGNVYAYEFKEE